MTHICVNKLTITGSGNGLSPGRRQAIIWNNTGILLVGPLGTNFSESLVELETFSSKKMHLKMSSGKWRPSCLGLNVLKDHAFVVSTVPVDGLALFSARTSACIVMAKFRIDPNCTSSWVNFRWLIWHAKSLHVLALLGSSWTSRSFT